MANAATGVKTRALAARVVDGVVSNNRSIDTALRDVLDETLDDRDVSFIKALAYGTLRTHLRNRALLNLLLNKPLKKKDSVVVALLSVGLFALLDSQRPDYAVVSATVSATEELGRKHMRGMVNAILRRFLRERDELLKQIDAVVEAHTLHPEWLVKLFQHDWPDNWEAIINAGNQQAPMWLRINEQHLAAQDWLDKAGAADISATAPVAAVQSAVLLDEAQSVNKLPGFAAGDCSVQDIASQLPAYYLQAEPGMRVLDACAAPGGKTGHLLEKYQGIELVAVDAVKERLEKVADNLERLGLQASVVCGDVLQPDQWWDGKPFDRILLDAPCSATGVIRRHPDIRYLRRESDIPTLAATQSELLNKLWAMLKPGGLLLYTTCSVLRAENTDVISHFMENCADAEEQVLPVLVQETAPGVSAGQQLLPNAFANDGFYYALLKRIQA
jgi:16S rRNA (cytosine967-C5)-methyltransferase